MEFLSTNGKYCVYPDSYAFTIPTMLLADTLQISHVITGDIWAAFTGDETIFTPKLSYRYTALFEAAGLAVEYPCNGIGEISSLRLADALIGVTNCTTCQYGEFRKPCMKCIKCFRKSLMMDALDNSQLVLDHLERFNKSPAILKFAEADGRKAAQFAPSIKWSAKRISYYDALDGPVRSILERSRRFPLDPSFADTCYEAVYTPDRPAFIQTAKRKMSRLIRSMSKDEIGTFRQLDWRKNGPV